MLCKLTSLYRRLVRLTKVVSIKPSNQAVLGDMGVDRRKPSMKVSDICTCKLPLTARLTVTIENSSNQLDCKWVGKNKKKIVIRCNKNNGTVKGICRNTCQNC